MPRKTSIDKNLALEIDKLAQFFNDKHAPKLNKINHNINSSGERVQTSDESL